MRQIQNNRHNALSSKSNDEKNFIISFSVRGGNDNTTPLFIREQRQQEIAINTY